MSKIFISYRREDSADATGRIYDRLVQQFGRTAVFKDVDSIPLGINFRKHLDEQVAKCDVFLAVIGPGWMGGKAGEEKSRLDDPRDFVRIEIESALKRQIPVIPVLVRAATIPDPERLPHSLQELADRNGIVVRHDPDFHRDMDRLIEHLRGQLEVFRYDTNNLSTSTKEIHSEVEHPKQTNIDTAALTFKAGTSPQLMEQVAGEPATSTPPARATTGQSQSYLFGVIGVIVLVGAVAAFLLLQPKSSPVYSPPVVEKKEEQQARVVPPPAPSRPAEPVTVPTKQERPVEKPIMANTPTKVVEKKEELTARQSSIPSPQMIRISPESFMMGDTNYGLPIHEVRFTRPFAMARYETTFDEYDRFARATGRPLPKDEGWGRESRPVINVSWNDAKGYAQWLSRQTGKRYRLPTEAEWESATRSGGKDETWAGTSDESQLENYAVYKANRTESVGSKKPNGLGLFDMSGNVFEWVEHCWHDSNKEGAPNDGSAWLDGADCGQRVVRGGSWFDKFPELLRASFRYGRDVDTRLSAVGFRLVQDIP